MRYAFWMLVAAAVDVAPVMLCHVAAEPAPKVPGESKATEKAPAAKTLLLLDDEPEVDSKETPKADNSRCHVCHLNFALEELAVSHARHGIGCNKCHGECDAHIDDESWAAGGPGTPPDIMYPRERIDSACSDCHDTHDVPAVKVVQRFLKRRPDKPTSARIVCTDCHGQHRVNPQLRKAWWDRKTRKPIPPSLRPRSEAP